MYKPNPTAIHQSWETKTPIKHRIHIYCRIGFIPGDIVHNSPSRISDYTQYGVRNSAFPFLTGPDPP